MSERKGFWRRLVSGVTAPDTGNEFARELRRAKNQLDEAKLREERGKTLEQERIKREQEEQRRIQEKIKLKEWQELFDRYILPVKPMVDIHLASLAEVTWGESIRKSYELDKEIPENLRGLRNKLECTIDSPTRDKRLDSDPAWRVRLMFTLSLMVTVLNMLIMN